MAKTEIDWKYELGELVYVRGATHTAIARPKCFVVIEQIASQCSGGLQLAYRFCNWSGPVPEIALCREEPPYQPESQQGVEDQCRILAQQEVAIRHPYDRPRPEGSKP